MNRKWLLALSILCGLMVFISVGWLLVTQLHEDIIMKAAVFPSGMSNESYYFVLYDDGVLKCSVGVRNNDDIKSKEFLMIIDNSAEIKISNQDLDILIEMANKLETSGFISGKQYIDDGWDAALLYNGERYEMNWGSTISPDFTQLIEKIMELSPISVDLRDFAQSSLM